MGLLLISRESTKFLERIDVICQGGLGQQSFDISWWLSGQREGLQHHLLAGLYQ